MRKAFQAIDVNNSGLIDREELTKALAKWNVPTGEPQVDALMKRCDHDGMSGERLTT